MEAPSTIVTGAGDDDTVGAGDDAPAVAAPAAAAVIQTKKGRKALDRLFEPWVDSGDSRGD